MSQDVIMPTDTELEFNYKKYGFHDEEAAAVKTEKGINEEVVRRISAIKNEPEWMLDIRLEGLRCYRGRPTPEWGADLSDVDFEDMHYYVSPTEGKAKQDWDDIPSYIKDTYEKLDRICKPEKLFQVAELMHPESPYLDEQERHHTQSQRHVDICAGTPQQVRRHVVSAIGRKSNGRVDW